MLHSFPRWKYYLLVCVMLLGLIYALPNIYGDDPAIQISGVKSTKVDHAIISKVQDILQGKGFAYKAMHLENDIITVRFHDTNIQLQAKDFIKYSLGDNYSVALNLVPVTPKWLDFLGAKPMKLGLDLRGGVRFLMEVDVVSNMDRRITSDFNEIRNGLRQERLRYKKLMIKDDIICAIFESSEVRDKVYNYIKKNFTHLDVVQPNTRGMYELEISINQQQIIEMRNYTVEQTVTTLRNRVNELGVAEAVVQRQGRNRIVVELPGIQDTSRARDILGKTATLDFVMVDQENDINKALAGRVPPGSRILYDKYKNPVLLKKRVILTGNSIVSASSGFDDRTGRPDVSIRLGGSGLGLFRETTLNNIHKLMAVIYRETKTKDRYIEHKVTREKVTLETVISIATIQGPLGNNFHITGLDLQESRDLALLLRSGSLPASVSIVEERIIGPSMGQDNIRMGIISVGVGLSLVLLFMAAYYSVFGIIANIALFLNLILLVALMSLLEATLTLPGIAGIVLTLGMAVDANVLIFERIREELRSGMTPQASIYRGFEHAFATIVDANLTTLIVGIILFAVGTGPVKGFAVTLSIGILTSMFTAITGTRAMINFIYRGKAVKKLLVGI